MSAYRPHEWEPVAENSYDYNGTERHRRTEQCRNCHAARTTVTANRVASMSFSVDGVTLAKEPNCETRNARGGK